MDARSAYRKELGQNASPLRLVVLLYEQLAEDLRRASAAIDAHEIATRTHHLSHALAVLGELEGSLKMEAGQEVASNLRQYYGVLRAGLLQVQFHPARRILEKYIAQVLSLREAWVEVERKTCAESPVVNPPAAQHVPDSAEHSGVQRDWSV
ncbi:MAG TPA: flagellar export chaperone FliS [Terriglobales bacterium]|nr:flagellar export chaperone FliS [Terriglobales bacterium]